MNENQTRQLLEQYLRGQEAALAAITVAIAQVIGKDALAEQLRLQMTSFDADEATNPVRDALLQSCWKAIRPPARY